MRPAALLTITGEDARVVAPRMTAGFAERRSAATRASSALVSRKVLLGWPERAADPALGFHANKIGCERVELEKRVCIAGSPAPSVSRGATGGMSRVRTVFTNTASQRIVPGGCRAAAIDMRGRGSRTLSLGPSTPNTANNRGQPSTLLGADESHAPKARRLVQPRSYREKSSPALPADFSRRSGRYWA